MRKQPSAIIIVRHGTRLDQADKNWRDTAEYPYDPPLSYGGWIQCQTLGARISTELQSLNDHTPEDLEREEDGEIRPRPTKKRKIIIHTSPYKRCMQTSIAIAAGLRYPQPEQLRPLPTPFQRSSLAGSRGAIVSATNGDPARSQPVTEIADKNERDGKIALRVDPYLSEWLSTSYFEDSKTPLSSDLIMRRAKETLMKPIQEIRGADLSAFLPVPESPDAEDTEKQNDHKSNAHEKGGLRAMAAAGHSLPHRTRHASFGLDRINGASPAVQRVRQRAQTTTVYSPPLPQYSLAPQDPIPAGYVAHARDACVAPDPDWDSVAMGWGDAGRYPEEWSAMHKRFRLGLQKLLAYYQEAASDQASDGRENDTDEQDIVLVLVTHQAGANALIRLVTGAPALHDVGVASLTLAVRRPGLRRLPSLKGTSHSPLGYNRECRRTSRRGSLDLGLADDFEMRIIASTEHLRIGSNPLGLNSPRLGRSPAMSGRRLVGADSLEGFSIGDPLGWRSGSSGNLGRGPSQRGHTGDSSSLKAANTGLWGSSASFAPAKEPFEEKIECPPSMSPKSRPTTPSIETDSVPESKLSSLTPSRSSTVQSTGLWGSSHSILSVPSMSVESTWGDSGANSAPGSGSVSRARSPAKRTWTSMSNSP